MSGSVSYHSLDAGSTWLFTNNIFMMISQGTRSQSAVPISMRTNPHRPRPVSWSKTTFIYNNNNNNNNNINNNNNKNNSNNNALIEGGLLNYTKMEGRNFFRFLLIFILLSHGVSAGGFKGYNQWCATKKMTMRVTAPGCREKTIKNRYYSSLPIDGGFKGYTFYL